MVRAGEWITKGLIINDLLKPDFLAELKKAKLNVVSLISIYEEKDKDGKPILIPVITGHENKQEIKHKILHLNSPNKELLDEILKIFKKFGAK